MFTALNDFLSEWKNETKATQRVMNVLTDASLKQEVAPGFRNLGNLAWHIVTAYSSILKQTGLAFDDPDKNTPIPSASEIAAAYEKMVEAVETAIKSCWTDETLQETRMMYGEVWPNGLTLRVVISHEIHHRGQMTILMRQAGIRIPDVYGPTKEMVEEMMAAKKPN